MDADKLKDEVMEVIDREDLTREQYRYLLESVSSDVESRLNAMDEEDENMDTG